MCQFIYVGIHRKHFFDLMLSNVFINNSRLAQCERIKSKMFLHLFHRHGIPPVLQDLSALHILFDFILLSVYESFDGAEKIERTVYLDGVLSICGSSVFKSLKQGVVGNPWGVEARTRTRNPNTCTHIRNTLSANRTPDV